MEIEIKSGIYCIENKNTYKKYIGQTNNLTDRWRRHVGELNNNKHHNSYLQNAWNKYGQECFKFYVLEYCSIDKLDEREIYYIDFYDTLNRNRGYNLTNGGQLNKGCYSEETKSKLSESVKRSYDNFLRDKRSNDALKQWSDSDIREKHSGENNGMYGKHHSEETKQKIREKRNARTDNRKKIRQVFCIELNQIFKNASIAAKELNLGSSSNLLNVCYGKRQTCGGYHWKFVENNW